MSNINKHILLGLLYRIIGITISFLSIPLMIKYLGIEKYGIWVTLLSIISWIGYFDIGIGNGLRNRISEEITRKNYNNVREYISTGYIIISLIALLLFILLITMTWFINWNEIFKSEVLTIQEFKIFMAINISFVLINFIASICNQLLYSLQKSSTVTLIKIINQLIVLLTVTLLLLEGSKSLIYMAFVFGFSNSITYIIFTLILFKNYREFIPNYRYFRKTKVRDITVLGGKFFIIQIAVLVLFTTDNIIITQLLGPKAVTDYSVVYKLFSVITIFHGIVLAPIWSAFTKYWTEKNVKQIRRVLRKLNLLQICIIIMSLLLIVMSDPIIKIWINNDISLDKNLVIIMGVYSLIYTWCNIYSYTLNGIGKIDIQVYLAIIQAIINIPISIFFVRFFNMGSEGVILGTVVTLCISAIITPIITYRAIRKIEEKS